MNKGTFTVPAFDVDIEVLGDQGHYLVGGEAVYLDSIVRLAADKNPWVSAAFTAALVHIDSLPKPDPVPGFPVRHEVDGDWKWTAVFCPLLEEDVASGWPWNVIDNCGNSAVHTREEFAALCDRDGVTW